MDDNFTDDELRAMARELRSKWPHMPEEQGNHAKNLIEQIDNYLKGNPTDRKAVLPMMARSIKQFNKARGTN